MSTIGPIRALSQVCPLADLIDRYDGDITVSDSPILSGPRFTVTLPNARE